MLNATFILKLKERLNKVDSLDFDNFQTWQILEAANTAQVVWVRKQLEKLNPLQQGDEQGRRRIDDLQVLIKYLPVNTISRGDWYEGVLPEDWLAYKRLDATARSSCCEKPLSLRAWEAEEVSVPDLMRDPEREPSFEWAETFVTFSGNTLKLWTSGKFEVESVRLVYYRMPRLMEVSGVSNAYTQLISTADVNLEFKNDICELIIHETAALLAGDIENQFQDQRETANADKGN